MGVINMAHGELIMIGAYATYVVQNLFRQYAPGAFDWYLLFAVPVAFVVSGLVGVLLERTVIRHLYGRPLETLLATWGLSLILIQAVRTIFGAQNVQVENPAWMSGGIEIMTNVVLPWSRIVIIAFAAFVLLLVWVLLTRTRLGLFVRAVTQNRQMASALGVRTPKVDMLAFGLGSGIAGLAGLRAVADRQRRARTSGRATSSTRSWSWCWAASGQLAGTVYAALGLGIANKFLEAWQGAVLAKIAVLVFIIIFIQKRPQGLVRAEGTAGRGMKRPMHDVRCTLRSRAADAASVGRGARGRRLAAPVVRPRVGVHRRRGPRPVRPRAGLQSRGAGRPACSTCRTTRSR